ncbi:hypothetical protein CDAR_419171 [Caerostris darwini]|uniref:Uncharacterized protein n=1 Tax=Caerostris darwini TaxID=1538125 RepID=A0AAV4MYP3_9ARAC|nr:hypothetical protein CDAR_419171 [Caerostris darwini]
MKFLVVLLFAVLAVAAAQRRVRLVYPRFPVYAAQDETYAASLGGAKSASTEGRAEDDPPSLDELNEVAFEKLRLTCKGNDLKFDVVYIL